MIYRFFYVKLVHKNLKNVKKMWFLVILETFTPISPFWTNNNPLLGQTKYISSKHMSFPTSSSNIRNSSRPAPYFWRHKIGKNHILWKIQNIAQF